MRHVLIADDHPVTRHRVRDLILEQHPGAVITLVADGDDVLAHLPRQRWDLLLLDALMPGPSIVSLLGLVRQHDPDLPVLAMIDTDEAAYVVEAMKAGARGIVHKYEADDKLLAAIEAVRAGGSFLPAAVATEGEHGWQPAAPAPLHSVLSTRELEIFLLIARGHAIKEIGFELGLSDKTVSTYVARIREKTGLIRPVDIARYALKTGLVN